MRSLFSWSLVPPKLIRWRTRLYYRVTERVQQVRFLPRPRSLNSPFPISQNLFHISFRMLQRLKVFFDTLELFLRKLVNAAAGSASSVTSFQDFGQLCQSEADPKRPLHYQHSLHGARGVEAVTRVCSRSSWENANPFIMSNRIWTHTSHLGERPGTQSFGTAALHHEKYEPSNAFQSQGICSRSFLARVSEHCRRRSARMSGYSSRAKSTHIGTHCIPPRNLNSRQKFRAYRQVCTDPNCLCYNSFTGQGQLLWVGVACRMVVDGRLAWCPWCPLNSNSEF